MKLYVIFNEIYMYPGIYLHFYHSLRSKRSLKKKETYFECKGLKKIWIIIHSIFLLSSEYFKQYFIKLNHFHFRI